MNVGPAGGGAPVGAGGGGGGGGRKRPRDVTADLLEAKREKRMEEISNAIKLYDLLREKGFEHSNAVTILEQVYPDYVAIEALRQIAVRR
jgi:hypothetical protein